MEREFAVRVGEVLRLVRYARRKYFGWVRDMDFEEMEAEGVFWVYKNARRYDPEKANFTTFVCLAAKSGMGIYVRREIARRKMCVDVERFAEILSAESEVEERCYDLVEEFGDVVGEYRGSKREIAEELLSGTEQVVIAGRRDVSKQYVSKIMCDMAEECRRRYDFVNGEVVKKCDRER